MEMPIEINLMLPDGTCVKKTTYETILQDILEAVEAHAFMPDEPYASEHLINPDLWGKIKGVHIIYGKCVADMARRGLIPFDIQGCVHDHRYFLKAKA